MTLNADQFGDSGPTGGNPDHRILPKGTVLQKRYEIGRTLHVGEQRTVYLVRDLHYGSVTRLCVLKETVLTTLDPPMREIATQVSEREATLLANLSHPGIPRIHDFFTEVDRVCLVMEYIEGDDLQAILESTQGMLNEATVLGWAIQICDILIYLHSQDPPIVFGDLKPSHVMLRGEQRTIILIDFAAARVFVAGRRGRFIVTEGYSAPERYQGIADPRSDVYALGATLHHLLTRRDPRRESPFTFHEKPPRALNPALSAATDAAIMKALEYDPAKRYPSAQAFRGALEAALSLVG